MVGATRCLLLLVLLVLPAPGSAVAAKVVPLPPGPAGVVLAAGPGHKVWFSGSAETKNVITPSYTGPEYSDTFYFGYFNSDLSATIISHQQAPGGTEAPYPTLQQAVLGPDGNFWALPSTGFIRTTPAGVATSVPSHLRGGQREQIIVGPDGNMWFTTKERQAGVGRLSTSGAVTIFTAGIREPSADITAGPDGNLWFTTDGGKLGHLSTAGEVRMVSVPGEASGIARAADGDLWTTASRPDPRGSFGPRGARFDSNLLRITPAGHATKMCASVATDLTAGPDHSVWMVDPVRKAIGRIDIRGNVYLYAHSFGLGAGDFGLVPGPEGDLWYVAGTDAKSEVHRIDPREASRRVCSARP